MEVERYKFNCGCEFDIISKKPLRIKIVKEIGNDNNQIRKDCPAVWDFISTGQTKGIFQLSSHLGSTLSKKLKPMNMHHLAGLISISRPGCLEAILEDGKSATDHYIDRKNGVEKVEYFHESLKDILEKSYGLLVYQEQAMQIAVKIAGFSLQEADNLRKAIGKKKVDLMAQVKKDFIEGCKRKGVVTAEEAAQIWDWIEKSQRYSFNACIDPSSVVYTKDGEKLLYEIKVGDFILAPENENSDHYVEVMEIFDNGEKEVYEIETEDGDILRCTLDHKIMCSDGKMRELKIILEEGWDIMVYDN